MKKERHCTYESNIEAPSCNHRYCRKAINNTYAEYVFVAFGTQHEICKSYILLVCVCVRPVRLYHIFPHYLMNSTIFGKCSCTSNVCIDFIYNVV